MKIKLFGIAVGVCLAVSAVVRTQTPAALPEGWRSQDIGAVGQLGSATESNGVFTISGAGADIWSTADAFHFAYRPLTGDGTIVAEVTSLLGAQAWTKMGVMIRASTQPGSAHAFMLVSAAKGLAFQRRTAVGGVSTHTSGGTGTAPRWVKLTRVGPAITASASVDGRTWTVVGRDTFALPATVLVGLAATSHDVTRLATGAFANVAIATTATGVHRHRLYAAVPGVGGSTNYGGVGILVFDADQGHRFVRRIPLPVVAGQTPEKVKGMAAHAGTGRLYVTTIKRLLAFDLVTNRLLWNQEYAGGADRLAIAPDGSVLYVPYFWNSYWRVVDARTGVQIARVSAAPGSHNTLYSLDGGSVFMTGLESRYLYVGNARTHTVARLIGPFSDIVRPFTINARQTMAFVNVNGLLGFEVADMASGRMVYRVAVKGYTQGWVRLHSCPSHGVALSPDEKEVWVVDAANRRMHLFDATVMPPRQFASILLRDQPGWITFSLDGRYAYPSTGDVIDAQTRTIVATLKDELGQAVQSEKMLEVIFVDGVPVAASDQFGVGRRQ
jgi:hypothetical protein